jgi:hypothetical protein
MNETEDLDRLLELCKKSQGEHLPVWHPSTSFATCYSDEFADASFKIYVLLRKNLFKLSALEEILHLFNRHGIRSCRRNLMDKQKVQYLYDTYWLPRLKRLPRDARAAPRHFFERFTVPDGFPNRPFVWVVVSVRLQPVLDEHSVRAFENLWYRAWHVVSSVS